MKRIPFQVSARTARLIGRENVANAGGAIIELVKNCYDADASNCIVYFDNRYSEIPSELDHKAYHIFCEETDLIRNCYKKRNSKYTLLSETGKEQLTELSSYFSDKCTLCIIDNGDGMNHSAIINKWMMIGTDNKEREIETDSGRIKAGAKGIGRFALDRLGSKSEMLTLPKGENKGYLWKVNWKDFEKQGAALSDIEAEWEELEQLNLKDKILSMTDNYNPLKKLLKEINFSNGTIIKISILRDEWDDDSVRKIFESLEILVPPKEMPIFQIDLLSSFREDKYGRIESPLCGDFDYKITAKHLDAEDNKVTITVERNELNFDLIEMKYKDVFTMKDMKKFPYDYETLKKGKFQFETSLYELLPGYREIDIKEMIKKIGQFEFVFYFLKNSIPSKERDVYPYKSISSASRRTWLKKFGGVKIFRDDFRIRPYGEDGNDWLNLGERQAESPGGAGQKKGGYRIRPNQISGSVHISRITNVSFQDKAGREGIQENDAFDLFRQILIGIVEIFEKDRNDVMFSFNQLHKRRNRDEETKKRAREIADERLKEKEEVPEEVRILSEVIEVHQREIQERENELRIMGSLAGIGLIVSSFAHELKSLRGHILSRTNELKDMLKKMISFEALKNLPEEDDPFIMLSDMRNDDEKLKHWLDYSLSTLRRDKRKRLNVDFSVYFSNFRNTWKKALEGRRTSLHLEGESDSCIIRAFEVDLDTVFNNLLVNSLDAFKRRAEPPFERGINILWKKSEKSVEVIYGDTGPGLSKDFNTSEDIFLPFKTSKRDRKGNVIGTGMGMYLVKTILEEYNADIRILDSKSGINLKMVFPLKKIGI
ncbi:MAG: ATP-binding protein [Deltaproteobacteria bacterium]|nr:MAG: ATP-binding protein [Deltaproteobacteria bacterium]